METYKEPEYAKTRLSGTIVQRKINDKYKAVFVQDVIGLQVQHLILSSQMMDMCTLPELDITPVPLGYVNAKGYASYVCRRPMRQDWRQGLRQISAVFVDGVLTWDTVHGKPIAECIEGNYPTYKQCIGKVIRNPNAIHSMAFSREFALRNDKVLLYKNTHVADVDDAGGLKYKEGYEWADDSFRELVN